MNTSSGSTVSSIVPAGAVRRHQSGEAAGSIRRAVGSCVTVFAAVVGVFLACAAQAAPDNVPKGWRMVRAGMPNADANYAKEDRDPNGKLQHVSALCGPDTMTAAALVATDNTRQWGDSYMQGNATTVVNLKGSVVKDPQPGNPNHCLIDGLSLSQIKGIWH